MSGMPESVKLILPVAKLKRTEIPWAAKYPLPPKVADFEKRISLSYLDLCYVNPAYHKLKTSLLKVVKLQEIVFANCKLWG